MGYDQAHARAEIAAIHAEKMAQYDSEEVALTEHTELPAEPVESDSKVVPLYSSDPS